MPKMKKSCGQKTTPKKMNFRSSILNINKGSSFTLINGSAKKTTK